MNENQPMPAIDYVFYPSQKREISVKEMILLPAALIIAVLFDRLIFARFLDDIQTAKICAGMFWLCYLIAFYAFYWKRLLRSGVLWFAAGCSAALCVWNFFFPVGNMEYSYLTYLVIPAVLMAHAQFFAGGYTFREAANTAAAWFLGWAVKPFSGLPAFAEAAGSLVSGNRKTIVKQASIGVLITLLLLCIIVPLLCGADMVFGYYINRILSGWNPFSLALHTFVIVMAFGFFYSFIWNAGFGENERVAVQSNLSINTVICCIVLSSVSMLYLMFCVIQFTYLFAGSGLPANMTYSAYAREGFAQTVAVCALNLVIFAVFLRFSARTGFVAGLLASLLGNTGVMLISGFVRLKLYIDTYGLTWLRLLSAWFVIYLSAVIILCAVRMLRRRLPVIAVCAMLLLGWYVALGYLNPDSFIAWYNQNYISQAQ